MVSDAGVCCGCAREECPLLNMFRGPPGMSANLEPGSLQPTVGAQPQGGWLPNFLGVYSGKLGRNVGQKCWAE